MSGSLLSDTKGIITEVLIVLSNDSISPGTRPIEWSCASFFVREKDVTAMVMSNGLYSADFRIGGILDQNVNRISYPIKLNLSDFGAAGFSNQAELLAWLTGSLPFSERFSIIEYKNGKIEDVKSLTWLNRYERSKELNAQFAQLSFTSDPLRNDMWSDGISGDTIRLVGSQFNGIDNQQLNASSVKKRIELLSQFNSEVNSMTLDWDRRFGISQLEIKDIRSVKSYSGTSKIEKWPQDQFIVRATNDKTTIGLRGQAVSKSEVPDFLAYCESIFPQPNWRQREDSLITEGGNMHVSGNILFLGMNERKKYKDAWVINNTDEISSRVLQLAFEDWEDKKLIWIGTDGRSRDTLFTRGPGHQPAYHTDLFFCPIGHIDRENPKKFTYLFAKPTKEFLLPSNLGTIHSEIQLLINWFNDTFDNLQTDIREGGFEPDPIILPLVLEVVGKETLQSYTQECQSRENPWISGYSPFANGLVNEKDGNVTYLMPQFKSIENQVILIAQNDAVLLVDSHIPRIGVVPIQGFEFTSKNLHDYGLRCLVKVIARK